MTTFWIRPLVLAALVFPTVSPALAMSVRAPTFAELVDEAPVVARARVEKVEGRFVTTPDGRRVIKTFVTFTTLTAVKGAPPSTFTLEFLGGEADGERWTIPGMPVFAAGDEEFVFPTAEKSICPLVGAMHGRYRVLTDPASRRRYVARDNLTPLTATADVVRSLETDTARAASDIAAALTPEDFERAIVAELQSSRPPAATK